MKAALSIMLLALAAVGFFSPQAGAAGYRQITADEAADLMSRDPNHIIVDVRTPAEYQSGHIPGAICIPNETILHEEIPELPDKDQLILVYCRSGNRSKQASAKLAALGYTNVAEFGGISAWPGEIIVS